jgi:propionyl-CoA synthetase
VRPAQELIVHCKPDCLAWTSLRDVANEFTKRGFMSRQNYTDLHRQASIDPAGFWTEAAQALDWVHPFEQVLDASRAPFYRWFEGGRLNTCFNAVDRHVLAGHGERTAVIYDSPVTNKTSSLSYSELLEQVSLAAGAMRNLGVGKGDRVVIYMPMVPETIVAMLACARLGAVHSVVFGGFAAPELAARIKDCGPKLIVTASCGIEPNRVIAYKPIVDTALEQAQAVDTPVLLLQRPQQHADMVAGRDSDWNEAISRAEPADCVQVAAADPLYILYTSGTTGRPKGVVRDNGGHAVALLWTMRHIYDVAPGEVFWAASDVGWVVGHSYIVYAPLLNGSTTLIFEGKPVGTPDAATFWRVVEQHRVAALFTAPTALRAIRKDDPDAEGVARHDISSMRALFLAGERSDPATVQWAQEKLHVPIVDHWWQTETGWAITGNPLGIHRFETRPGSATVAMPGWQLHALDEAGNQVPAGETGALAVRLPMPPGSLLTFWNADDRFIENCLTTFPGYYETADAGVIDEDGYVSVMTRTDDIINVAGHRLSAGAIEEVVAGHAAVAECAVVGRSDSLKGHVPFAFVVRSAQLEEEKDDDLSRALIQRVREHVGAIAAMQHVLFVDRLPKTRSGKTLRASLRKIVDGEEFPMPATIEDPAVLSEVSSVFKAGKL